MITELDDRIKEEKAEANKKTKLDKIKETYKARGGSLPKCTRVTIVSEAEFVGETIPFYNTYKAEGEEDEPVDEDEDGKKKKKKVYKNLFFPRVKFTFKKERKNDAQGACLEDMQTSGKG
jgi:hypothetical protein